MDTHDLFPGTSVGLTVSLRLACCCRVRTELSSGPALGKRRPVLLLPSPSFSFLPWWRPVGGELWRSGDGCGVGFVKKRCRVSSLSDASTFHLFHRLRKPQAPCPIGTVATPPDGALVPSSPRPPASSDGPRSRSSGSRPAALSLTPALRVPARLASPLSPSL